MVDLATQPNLSSREPMNDAAIILIPIGGVLLLLLVWFIATFNRLVGVRQHIRESWSDVDVELKRRYDLIPNLVATVKGYAAHEQAVLEQVTRLRNAAAAGHGTAAEHAVDETALAIGLKQLFAVVENYPQLKADAHFLALQQELAITEDRLAAARRFFNANVRELNQLRETFPSALVAGMLGVERASYFELANDAERTTPQVAIGA
jgi:LemA protein